MLEHVRTKLVLKTRWQKVPPCADRKEKKGEQSEKIIHQ